MAKPGTLKPHLNGENKMRTNGRIFWLVLGLLWVFIPVLAAQGEVLTFKEGLNLATAENRLIRITQWEEAVSEADTNLARSRLLPTVNASAGRTSMAYQPRSVLYSASPLLPRTIPQMEQDFYSYSLNLQQTLFDFRSNSSRYEASKLILDTKKWDTRRVRNLVALQFAQAYFDLLEVEKTVRVVQKEIRQLESHLYNAKNLFEQGVITKNDLLQAQVRLSDARQRLLSIRNLRATQASRVNNLINRSLKEPVELAEIKDLSGEAPVTKLEKAWEEAEKTRPEIKIADLTLQSLDKEATARLADYLPRFYGKGGYDYTENKYQLNEGNWSVTLAMSINLFSGGATQAELIKIKKQKEKLLEQKNKLVDDLRLEVEKACLDLANSFERIAVTRDAIAQAGENLRINRARYEEGVGTATDVLDAVTLDTVAESNFYKAQYDFRRAEAAYFYATGRDLTEVYP
jgi:outer membrane protein TolC